MTIVKVRAPLRLTLAGGGTDIPEHWRRNGGCVVSATIDKYLTVEVIPDIVPGCFTEDQGLRRYVGAAGWKGGAFECYSDVPAGKGLGGSGALMVALLKARHPGLQPAELAAAAYNIERYTLNRPVGIQDQYIAAYGGARVFQISRFGDVHDTPLTLPAGFNDRLLLMDTGMTRQAAGVLADQAKSLCTKLVTREAMEFIQNLGQIIYDDLVANEGRGYGRLTHDHWMFKKATSTAMSNPAIDAWYDLAREHGASGGKLVGAGGGGFLLLVVEPPDRNHLVEVLTEAGLVEMPFRFTDKGAEVT